MRVFTRHHVKWALIVIAFALTGVALAILAARQSTTIERLDASRERVAVLEQQNAEAQARSKALSDQVKDLGETPVVTVPEVVAGAPGATGATGLTGPKGETGDTGPRGFTGLTGPTGKAGEPGMPGPTGPIGKAGDDGASVVGPAGPKGEKGDPGERGPAGADGESIVGPVGPAGADSTVPGPAGPQGEPGQSAYPFTFSFPVQTNPAQTTTYTVTCTAPGACTVTTS